MINLIESYLDSLLLDEERTLDLDRLHTVRVCLSRESIIG